MRKTPALAAFAVLSACASPAPDLPGERLAINVAPLSLGAVTDAVYELTVLNADGETVWTKQLSSTSYGDGSGSVSYVGTCDAASNPNTVQLVVVSISDASGPLTAGVDYMNPAPAGTPVELDADCVADADVPVTFEVTFARAAQQGFFDVAVTFDDIFCSAKLDCQDAAGDPLRLLFDADGSRGPTAVMAFACTAGDGADTRLYLSNLEVDCGGGDVTTIDPTLGPGTLARLGTTDVPNTHIFEAMVTRGAEQLGTWNKMYWNVALGLADVTGCTFNAEGTASDGLFADGATPADGTWPYLSWSGPLDTCTHHGLDSGDGVVETLYARPPGISFAASFDGLAAAPFVFDIPIAGALTALDPGRYADGSYAVSCFDYKNPVAPYVYAGATGDGVYTIDLDGAAGGYAPMDVYCDMTTDGGGWTEITACQARNDLNGTMVAVQVGTGSGFDAATCSPYAQDQAGVHTYHYTFDFPPGFGEFYLNGYTVKAKSPSSSYTSEIGPAQFTMTTWTAANNAAYGDVGFGDAAASGPTITYSQTLSATVMCTSCTIPWPQDGTVYTVATGPATQFRVGWGEGGGEYEGWYAWWAGTVRLR